MRYNAQEMEAAIERRGLTKTDAEIVRRLHRGDSARRIATSLGVAVEHVEGRGSQLVRSLYTMDAASEYRGPGVVQTRAFRVPESRHGGRPVRGGDS